VKKVKIPIEKQKDPIPIQVQVQTTTTMTMGTKEIVQTDQMTKMVTAITTTTTMIQMDRLLVLTKMNLTVHLLEVSMIC